MDPIQDRDFLDKYSQDIVQTLRVCQPLSSQDSDDQKWSNQQLLTDVRFALMYRHLMDVQELPKKYNLYDPSEEEWMQYMRRLRNICTIQLCDSIMLSPDQYKVARSIRDQDQSRTTLLIGRAGSGKTFLIHYLGLKEMPLDGAPLPTNIYTHNDVNLSTTQRALFDDVFVLYPRQAKRKRSDE